MLFSLPKASQTFQRFIDSVLRGLDFCCAYVDDILIARKTEEEHIKHLEELFRRQDEHDLVVNSDKCCFGRVEVSFLGTWLMPKVSGLSKSKSKQSYCTKHILIQNDVH